MEAPEANRVINFAAGPSALPLPVLKSIRDEFLDWGPGMSIVETSHRSKSFGNLLEHAKSTLARLLNIRLPAYDILWMHGGGTGQFAAVPLNLGGDGDYVVTGRWSSKACSEAKKWSSPRVALTPSLLEGASEPCYDRIPSATSDTFRTDASYVYVCDNETVNGVEWMHTPEVPPEVPLVSDMSSNILTRSIPVDNYGVIFAGAQKNIGPAGTTLVIVRRDLLGKSLPSVPSVLDWSLFSQASSMPNTPSTFPIYCASKMFDWIDAEGGVDEMARRVQAKADAVYASIEAAPTVYKAMVQPGSRSRCTVTFDVVPKDKRDEFVQAAAKAGFHGVAGHRSVGGCRVALYNGVGVDQVQALTEFMDTWAEQQQQ